MKKLPSTKYLRACFSYNKQKGLLRWKRRPRTHFATEQAWKIWNARFSGRVAGTHDTQYVDVSLDYDVYRSHRLIWKLVTGKEPVLTIDHKDLRKRNNRWKNLRIASETEQRWNIRKRSSTGFRGVSKNPRCRSKWWARIKVGDELRYLGSFPTPEQASIAFEAAARKVHGKFYRK